MLPSKSTKRTINLKQNKKTSVQTNVIIAARNSLNEKSFANQQPKFELKKLKVQPRALDSPRVGAANHLDVSFPLYPKGEHSLSRTVDATWT